MLSPKGTDISDDIIKFSSLNHKLIQIPNHIESLTNHVLPSSMSEPIYICPLLSTLSFNNTLYIEFICLDVQMNSP